MFPHRHHKRGSAAPDTPLVSLLVLNTCALGFRTGRQVAVRSPVMLTLTSSTQVPLAEEPNSHPTLGGLIPGNVPQSPKPQPCQCCPRWPGREMMCTRPPFHTLEFCQRAPLRSPQLLVFDSAVATGQLMTRRRCAADRLSRKGRIRRRTHPLRNMMSASSSPYRNAAVTTGCEGEGR
jgi:hypothetical protein